MAKILQEVPEMEKSESLPPDDGQYGDLFEKILRSRRSVRVYTQEKIPEHIVHRCLDLALLAPTSSNLQCWKFIRVVNVDLKKQLAYACFSQQAAKTASELIVCVAQRKTWKKHAKQMLNLFDEQEKAGQKVPKAARDYYQKIAPFIYNQGFFSIYGLSKKIFFSAVGLFRPVPREPMCDGELKTWAHKTTALACENLMLSFRAFGYDTCPMEGFDSVRVKKILKLKKDEEITMIISAGKRASNGVYGPQIRFPREQFIFEM
jgi:nitroreductase